MKKKDLKKQNKLLKKALKIKCKEVDFLKTKVAEYATVIFTNEAIERFKKLRDNKQPRPKFEKGGLELVSEAGNEVVLSGENKYIMILDDLRDLTPLKHKEKVIENIYKTPIYLSKDKDLNSEGS